MSRSARSLLGSGSGRVRATANQRRVGVATLFVVVCTSLDRKRGGMSSAHCLSLAGAAGDAGKCLRCLRSRIDAYPAIELACCLYALQHTRRSPPPSSARHVCLCDCLHEPVCQCLFVLHFINNNNALLFHTLHAYISSRSL